jgi:ABC-2 type transport system ATP-binding protein
MIKASHLTKTYKNTTAVSNISFQIETGKVTGFLGPNGAGKSTTMRLILGLDNGGGTTTFDSKLLHSYTNPSSIVGILLEAKAYHPTRTAQAHLKVLATAGGVPISRVPEVLDIVGLSQVAKKSPSKFSLGMSQRLGIAAAILAHPKYLMLDEPANGLDPEGIVWLRGFLKDYADQGNAVFVSSHLLSEMALMADNVIVIAKGELIADTSIKDLVTSNTRSAVFVRSSNLTKLESVLKEKGYNLAKADGGLNIEGVKSDEVGELAFVAGINILELSQKKASLEDVFLELTEGKEEFAAHKSQQGNKR